MDDTTEPIDQLIAELETIVVALRKGAERWRDLGQENAHDQVLSRSEGVKLALDLARDYSGEW